MTQQNLLLLVAIFGFIGVALGAFGAHALEARLTENDRLGTFETGVRYHLIHTVAALGVAILAYHMGSEWIIRAGYFFLIGIVFFSGSLYVLSLMNIRIMGAVAPIGGTFFLLGWGALFLGVLRSN